MYYLFFSGFRSAEHLVSRATHIRNKVRVQGGILDSMMEVVPLFPVKKSLSSIHLTALVRALVLCCPHSVIGESL